MQNIDVFTFLTSFEKEFNQLALKYNLLLDNYSVLEKQHDERNHALEQYKMDYSLLLTQYNEKKNMTEQKKPKLKKNKVKSVLWDPLQSQSKNNIYTLYMKKRSTIVLRKMYFL